MTQPPIQPASPLAAWQTFLATSLDAQLARSQTTDPAANAIAVFHQTVATVPAYRAFLAAHGVDPAAVQAIADFQHLPLLTKANYLQQYSLADLCRFGQIESCDMIAASSGSTGQPTFWLRSLADELQIATRFEQVFYDSFRADERRTLAIVCFALGTWVGGMFTTQCCRYLAAKGYPLTVITPGNNKTEILRVVQALGSEFDQVVLLGYPPFLKDVIDSGLAAGVPWANYTVKLVMAGEVFSEEWRSLVGQRLGGSNPCTDFASLYGTADAGVLGTETPLSITIRRWLADHPAVAQLVFGEWRLPTLVQYDPTSRYFETQDGTLLFSGDNGMPLIRYHISDQGGIISYEQMLATLANHGFDPTMGLERGVRSLPFVYVFGRSHFTISYFGANVFPENVTVGLEQVPICNWVTGKFVMQVLEDGDRNTFLAIVVELAPGQEADAKKQVAIAHSIKQNLCRLNSEFANYVPAEKQIPHITLRPAGDPDYFPVGVKHRYTRKTEL